MPRGYCGLGRERIAEGGETQSLTSTTKTTTTVFTTVVCAADFMWQGGGDGWANWKQINKGQHTKFLLVEDDFWMKDNLKYAWCDLSTAHGYLLSEIWFQDCFSCCKARVWNPKKFKSQSWTQLTASIFLSNTTILRRITRVKLGTWTAAVLEFVKICKNNILSMI